MGDMVDSAEKQRNICIDFLKGVATIAVVFFHLKVLTFGYFGVDVFFVIAGFFTALSVENNQESGSFRYSIFLWRRLVRLMPLILLASFFCLVVGLWGMLPDDFENLAESVVASNLLSENILQLATTKNYWDVSQDYKPLMHLWYVGVLFEFYIIYPLIIIASDTIVNIVKRSGVSHNETYNEQGECGHVLVCHINKHRATAVLICSIISITLYFISFLFPTGRWMGAEYRFYCIQFRFFEFGTGALCYLVGASLRGLSRHKGLFIVGVSILLILLVSPIDVIASGVRLVIVVLIATYCVFTGSIMSKGIVTRAIAGIGKRSYSIYIWHQVIIAFYRYYFSDGQNVRNILIIIGATIAISECSYRAIECGKGLHEYKTGRLNLTMLHIVLFFITTGFAMLIYMKSGIIRDVPELGLYTNSSRRHMHKEYSERIYKYDKDYENNGKIKVFVTGVSYGRDFCNVLLESKMGGMIDLSFAQVYTSDYRDRVEQADYVFSVGDKNHQIPEFYKAGKGQYWGVGSKRFGYSNGIIYRHRKEQDYFEQTVPLKEEFWDKVILEKAEWSNNYIDMMAPVTEPDGTVRVFTDDNMFISQDTEHLTEAGAKYYARVIDWDRIFWDE